jgi:hypothetical protein
MASLPTRRLEVGHKAWERPKERWSIRTEMSMKGKARLE